MTADVAELPEVKKPRKIPQAPAGDFTRGALMWLPSQLRPRTTLTLTVPLKPPSLNELNQLRAIDARRQGHHGYNDFKERWEEIVRHFWVTQSWETGQRNPPCIRGAYRVNYLYVCADRRSDVSNLHAAFEKILLDALVSRGALASDRFVHHRGSSYEPQHQPGKWGVVVTITELPDPPDMRKAVGKYRTRRRVAGRSRLSARK